MVLENQKKSRFNFHLLVSVSFLALSIVYIWQINHQAQNSFAIYDLEKQKTQLLDSIHDKEIQYSSARSLSSIADRASNMNLINPKEVTYLKIGSSAVAVEYDQIKN